MIKKVKVAEIRTAINNKHEQVKAHVHGHKNKYVWSSVVLVSVSVITFGFEMLGVATVFGVLGTILVGLIEEA